MTPKALKRLQPKHYGILLLILQDHMNTIGELSVCHLEIFGGTLLDYLDELRCIELTLIGRERIGQ